MAAPTAFRLRREPFSERRGGTRSSPFLSAGFSPQAGLNPGVLPV